MFQSLSAARGLQDLLFIKSATAVEQRFHPQRCDRLLCLSNYTYSGERRGEEERRGEQKKKILGLEKKYI